MICRKTFARMLSNGFSAAEALDVLEREGGSKGGGAGGTPAPKVVSTVTDKGDPYVYRKDRIQVPMTGADVVVRNQKKRMARCNYTIALVELNPGALRSDIERAVQDMYPDRSAGGLASYISNAANGTGPCSGAPHFRQVDGRLYPL